MTWPPIGIATVVVKVKTRVPTVVVAPDAPDFWSAALVTVLADTASLRPPRAVGATLVPALSMVKLLAAMVEAVTANPT